MNDEFKYLIEFLLFLFLCLFYLYFFFEIFIAFTQIDSLQGISYYSDLATSCLDNVHGSNLIHRKLIADCFIESAYPARYS